VACPRGYIPCECYIFPFPQLMWGAFCCLRSFSFFLSSTYWATSSLLAALVALIFPCTAIYLIGVGFPPFFTHVMLVAAPAEQGQPSQGLPSGSQARCGHQAAPKLPSRTDTSAWDNKTWQAATNKLSQAITLKLMSSWTEKPYSWPPILCGLPEFPSGRGYSNASSHPPLSLSSPLPPCGYRWFISGLPSLCRYNRSSKLLPRSPCSKAWGGEGPLCPVWRSPNTLPINIDWVPGAGALSRQHALALKFGCILQRLFFCARMWRCSNQRWNMPQTSLLPSFNQSQRSNRVPSHCHAPWCPRMNREQWQV